MSDKPTTEQNKKFWHFVQETSKRVENWPVWKKEGWDVLDRQESKSNDGQLCSYKEKLQTCISERKVMSDDVHRLVEENQTLSAQLQQAQSDIDQFWETLEQGWDIESRSYFEEQARKNGFDSPLAMAAHYMWKREADRNGELLVQSQDHGCNCEECERKKW